MTAQLSTGIYESIRKELDDLDQSYIEVDGVRVDPKQCYYFSMDPPHILFNTNCPETLRQRISGILSKFIEEKNETGTANERRAS